MARERVAFQGLPARICWLGYGERAKAGAIFNDLVASGAVKAPIVIGRDHLDSGSVASPYRETEAMADGSDAIADWPILNALRTSRPAPPGWPCTTAAASAWASPSTPASRSSPTAPAEAAERLDRVLTNDPAMGVLRHADAGYDRAREVAAEPWRAHPDGCRPDRRPGGHRHRTPRHVGPRAPAHRSRRADRAGRRPWPGWGRSATCPRRAPAPRLDAGGRAVIPGFVDAHTHPVFAGERGVGVRRPHGRPGVQRRRHPQHRRGDPRRHRCRAGGHCAPAGRRGPAPGHDHAGGKSGYGLDRRRRGAQPARRRAPSRTPRPSWAPTSSPPSTRATATATSRSSSARCSTPARRHADWIDVFCEEGAFDRRRDSRDPRGRAAPRGWASACTPTSCSRPRVPASRPSWARPAPTTAPTSTTTTSPRWRAPGSSPRWSRPRSSAPAAATRPRAACWTPARPSPWRPTATPARATRPPCPSSSPSPCSEQHLTVEEALRAATLGGAASLRLADVGHLRPGARADLVVLDAPDPVPPGLPPRCPPRPHRRARRVDRHGTRTRLTFGGRIRFLLAAVVDCPRRSTPSGTGHQEDARCTRTSC